VDKSAISADRVFKRSASMMDFFLAIKPGIIAENWGFVRCGKKLEPSAFCVAEGLIYNAD
jgi:hypothetical protein